MAIRIVIADDHPIVVDGLAQLFSLEIDFEVVARCSNGLEALAAVRSLEPDVLILDLRMPHMSGLEVIREIQKYAVPSRIILLTALFDDREVDEAIRLGVRGVMLKDLAPPLMIQCIRTVYAGGEWIERDLMDRALERLSSRGGEPARPLTPREREIVQMVVRGLRNKEIAGELSISEGTVKIHLHSIYEKLGVGGRLELSVYARDHGLVS